MIHSTHGRELEALPLQRKREACVILVDIGLREEFHRLDTLAAMDVGILSIAAAG